MVELIMGVIGALMLLALLQGIWVVAKLLTKDAWAGLKAEADLYKWILTGGWRK